jgi:hypothetical protein
MPKYVVYTAIFNNYDTLKEPLCKSSEIDYVCFTDNYKLKSKIWRIIYYNNTKLSASLNNRYLKILGPYNELKDYDYSIYIDGSILIKKDLSILFLKNIENPLVNFKHPQRNCLYDEIEQCLVERRGNIQGLYRQALYYLKMEMPYNYQLSDNKVFLRNHHSDIIRKVMFEWWEEVQRFSGRDQVCLPYILWRNDLQYKFFKEKIDSNKYLVVGPHKKEYIRRLGRAIKENKLPFFPKKLLVFLEKKIKEKLY